MFENLKAHYNLVCAFISENFDCETERGLFEMPPNLPSQQYAELVNTERSSGVINNIYTTRNLAFGSLNLTNDYKNFLERDFLTLMADTFKFSDLKYMKSLFQHFVHDGNRVPNKINEIIISDLPSEDKSEALWSLHKKECETYVNPTSAFLKKYDLFEDLGSSVWISNRSDPNSPFPSFSDESRLYRIVKLKTTLTLEDSLKKENMSPVLRHLIKLWIIHILVSESSAEDL